MRLGKPHLPGAMEQLSTHIFFFLGVPPISAVGMSCSPGLVHRMGPSSLWLRWGRYRDERSPHGRVRRRKGHASRRSGEGRGGEGRGGEGRGGEGRGGEGRGGEGRGEEGSEADSISSTGTIGLHEREEEEGSKPTQQAQFCPHWSGLTTIQTTTHLMFNSIYSIFNMGESQFSQKRCLGD